jgi:DNA polymerase-3 subunit delta'
LAASNDFFTIDSVLGQDKAKKMLRRAVAGERLSHAYLFRGPAGVGKRTMARAFSNYLNCDSPSADQDSCTTCRSCHKLMSGNHPDLLMIEPDGVSIKIGQIRELKHTLTFPPFEANCRVVVINDVHTMRREAANSLLKTLEEPPPGNQLILTGDAASAILPTITSRCQTIPFTGLPPSLVKEKLISEGVESGAAATLAEISGGSLGQARSMADLDILKIRRDIVTGLLALQPEEATTVNNIFQLAGQAADLSSQLPELIELLRLWFRDLVLAAQGLPGRIINHDLHDLLDEAVKRWTISGLQQRLDLFDKARKQLDRNCNRALVCESLFFALL